MRLKRLLLVIFAIIMTAFVSVNAAELKYGKLSYEIFNGEVTITGCDKNVASSTIPEKIGKYPVTTIGDNAFSGCQILSVTIPDTVRVICSGAFSECENLKSVIIPESVASVGSSAFYGCTDLTSVTLPDSLTVIGNGFFNNCKSLTSVKLPENTAVIGDYAFYNCTSLKNITIPDDVLDIGEYAFVNTAYYSTASNWEDGVLYIGKNLIASGTTLPDVYTVKAGTRIISGGAFANCSDTLEFVIPDSVVAIGDRAFADCYSMTSVSIPDSVKRIGSNAFNGCRRLTTVVIPNSITQISDAAFYNCTGLTSVTIPDSVTNIGNNSFYGCGFDSVTIPDSVVHIGYFAFAYTKLTSVTVPDSVEAIGAGAFENTSMKEISIPFVGENKYGKGETRIGHIFTNLRYGSNNICIEKVTVTGDAEIAEYAFAYCNGLKEITILGNVTSIKGSTFAYCYSLSKVTLPDSVTSIGVGAFKECGITSFTVPDGVKTIGGEAFDRCGSLSSVTLPDGLENIGYGAFYKTAYFNNTSNWDNGVLYLGNHLISAKTSLTDTYTVKPGTKVIAGGAFEGCKLLEKIVLPDSVITLGDSAFSNCEALTECTIPNGVEVIGDGAFSSTALTSVNFPDSLISIGEGAFAVCGRLSGRINIPESVQFIGAAAFRSCSKLNTFIIPDSTKIGSKAFEGTNYYDADSNWENGVLYIGNHLISAKTDIEGTYTVKPGTKSIASGAFGYCNSLKEVIIPDSVTYIGDNAFSYSKSLTSVKMPSRLDSIEKYTFKDCIMLSSITIPEGVKIIGERAFECCNIRDVVIPEGVTTVCDDAFHLNGMVTLTVPASLTKVGNLAFDSNKLEKIYITDIAAWCNIDFESASTTYSAALYVNGEPATDIVIPSNVKVVKSHTFNGFNSIQTITFSKGVEIIYEKIFEACPDLQKVVYPKTVKYLADNFNEAGYKGTVLYGFIDSCKSEYSGNVEILDNVKYTVKYNLNGGSGSIPDAKKKHDEVFTVTTAQPEKENAKFVGWSTEINGSLEYKSGDALEDNKSLTLYAVWHPVIKVDSRAVAVGGTFELPVVIYSNIGLTSASFTVTYPEFLTLEKVTQGDALRGLEMTVDGNNVKFEGSEAVGNNGSVAVFTFKVAENAPLGTANVTVTVSDACDKLMNVIEISPVTAELTVKEFLPGDINGDCIVDLKDVSTLRRYLAGGYDVSPIEAALDVTNDGIVDLKDVTYIRRALAGGYGITLK